MRYVLLAIVLLLLGGCDRYRTEYFSPITDAGIVRQNRILAAEIRRNQVIADIARLNNILRFAGNVENRIVVESLLDERRSELIRLNALIGD